MFYLVLKVEVSSFHFKTAKKYLTTASNKNGRMEQYMAYMHL